MRLEMINENRLKIIFDSKELEESNISVHSFLSNSLESQKLFLAILDIAYEDFGFDFINSKISYESYSFDNKTFVIFVNKTDSLTNSIELSDFSKNLFCNSGVFSRDYNNSKPSSFKFEGNCISKKILDEKTNNIFDSVLYYFNSFEEIFDFCSSIKHLDICKKINSSLLEYKNMYFLELTPIKEYTSSFYNIIKQLSEFKTNTKFSNINKIRLIEFSSLLIKNNAIEIL